LVNEGCLYKCPFRKFHFNYLSHASKEVDTAAPFNFEKDCCIPVAEKDMSEILKSPWIRPEDLRKYSAITKFFKVVGRRSPMLRALRVIQAYMYEKWKGNFLDIMDGCLCFSSEKSGAYIDNRYLEEARFFEKVTSCNKNCNNCDYCAAMAKKIIDIKRATPE
jgi:collagenase-like PrtC family protease